MSWRRGRGGDECRRRRPDIVTRDVSLLAGGQFHFAITERRVNQRHESIFLQFHIGAIPLLRTVAIEWSGIGGDGIESSTVRGRRLIRIRFSASGQHDRGRDRCTQEKEGLSFQLHIPESFPEA